MNKKMFNHNDNFKLLKILGIILLALLFNIIILTLGFKINNIKQNENNKNENNLKIDTLILNGIYKEYKDTSLYSIKFYKNNLPDSTWVFFYKNGNIKRTKTYKNGQRTGKDFYYSPKNKIIFIEKWNNNILKEKIILDTSYFKYKINTSEKGEKLFEKSIHKKSISNFLNINDSLKFVLLTEEGFNENEIDLILIYIKNIKIEKDRKALLKNKKKVYIKKKKTI